MPGYPDDRSRERRHRDRRDYYDDGSDEEYYRPRPPKSRDPRYTEPQTNGRSSRRRDNYDEISTDEDDRYLPRRRSDRDQSKSKARESPDIPPPPIGGDRRTSKSRRPRPDDPPPGAIPVPETEAMNGAKEDDGARHRRGQSSRTPREDAGEGPYSDAEIMPDPRKSSRERDGRSSRRKPPKDVDDYDETEPPRRYKPRDNHRDRYEDSEPPRRSKRDPYDEPPRGKRDSYDEPPRRKPARPDPEAERRYRKALYVDGDSDDEYEKPRRREKPNRYDEEPGKTRSREKTSRYDDGYGTDRPRRQPRDDYYDRGYRTDGRDSRRDKYREEDRRRSGRHRDDYYDDYDRKRHDKPRASGRGGRDGMDMNGMLEKGQKHWKKVEPVAKPLLAQLAKTYLQDGSRA